ncbi:MAG: metallophosphoesterase [Kineosporiaceae bacterium]
MSRRDAAARAAGLVLASGGAVAAWSLAEAASYRVRRVAVPPLSGPGAAPAVPLRVLHLSDLHLAPWQRRKRAWLRGLAALEPDLTVVTGDFLGHRDAVPVALEALDGLLDRPGAFVLGSNDYVAPRFANPLRYLAGPTARRHQDWSDREKLPTGELVSGLTARGWVDLDNRRGSVRAGGVEVDLVGVDDPHHGLDRMPAPAPVPDGAALRLGVAHAPYRRVLDAMTADGAGLVLAGHTHGGQVCVPGWGALVTNCDLDPRYAQGLFAWSVRDGDGWERRSSWVHVTPGVGTSPYTPVRLACPPEASLLHLS